MPDREALTGQSYRGSDSASSSEGPKSEAEGVPVLDGPYEGARLPYSIAAPASVLLEGDGVPDGYAARYRYNTRRHGYVFKGLETIVMRVPRDG